MNLFQISSQKISFKARRFRLALILLALGLGLLLAFPARADLTPGRLDTGFDPGTGADGVIWGIVLQPDGKVLLGGGFTTINGTSRNRIARLNADGTLDASFDPGTGASFHVDVVALQPDGKVLIGGRFISFNGTTRNYIARLNTDGSLDTSFNPGTGPNAFVLTLALQPDGKVLIGGAFTTVNGTPRNHIARLNADGSLDTSFNPGAGADDWVRVLALQADQKVLIGGDFTNVAGVGRNYIARLNADGSHDTTFNPGAGASNKVEDIIPQPDGKVLLGGGFSTIDGTARLRIARLNANGSLDTTFDPGAGPNSLIGFMALQPDGKVLIGGNFTAFDGTARTRIARLNADGSLDTTFDPGAGADDWVVAMALEPDGKVLLGGHFTTIAGVARVRIARLNADASLNVAFDPAAGPNDQVWPMVLQPDGRLLIGGAFTTISGTQRTRVARLMADGSLDGTFDPGLGPDSTVTVMALQPDGKVLIGGQFVLFAGTTRKYLARLHTNGSLDTALDPGPGPDDSIWAMALQANGKVLIGGDFGSIGPTSRPRLARLNEDGSLDTTFDPGVGANNSVTAIALQLDGKMLIGGLFTTVGGVGRNRIARLNADGSLDATFDPGTGANNTVYSIAVQPDGKILIGGLFTTVDGVGRNRIARLNADGSLDTSFNPGTGLDNTLLVLALQPDGKVLIGGLFTTVNGTSRTRIARLNANGSLDAGFDHVSGPNNFVRTITLQPDGKVLIGGAFTSFDGQPRSRVARLNGATPPVFPAPTPPQATHGSPYSYAFNASGNPTPWFYRSGGQLPPGLSLGASGVLSGTATSAGTYNFTVAAHNYAAPSALQLVSLTVAKADTTAAITGHSPHPSDVGQTVTIQYNVSSTGGIPTGNVTISDGTTHCIGSVAQGSCTMAFPTPGTHTLTASYAGDANFNTSVSAGVAHPVNYPTYLPLTHG